MSLPIRTISQADAEFLARTIVVRIATKGRIEYLGLQWRSDALLDWENGEREAGREPKVEVYIDELDLEFAYIDVPDRGVGPFKAISRQPNFTRGLSVYELNRLKKVTKEKEIEDRVGGLSRIGRLADEEACRLRLEYYQHLGHAADPAARERLVVLMDRLAQKRLAAAEQLIEGEPNFSVVKPVARNHEVKAAQISPELDSPNFETAKTPEPSEPESTTTHFEPRSVELTAPTTYSTTTVRRRHK